MSTWLISGASGLVGTSLVALLHGGGHTVRRLVRRAPHSADEVAWFPSRRRIGADAFDGVDVVINLSGASIGGRFTEAHKRAILDSRLAATTTLAMALAASGSSAALVQASAIGVYGARRPDELLDEASPRGTGFLADVVEAWEAAAAPAGVRTVFIRTGIVLSSNGGALKPQLPLFQVGLGGPLAPRRAWLSWISLNDLARSYLHAGLTTTLSGPVNAVSPNPVTHGDFATALGRAMHRPSLLPTPAFGPKLILGAEGYDQLINTDQRVSPSKLLDSRFEFRDGDLAGALTATLRGDG